METQGGKYLTFTLKKETYGIPIKKVKEIIGMMEITNLPKTQKYIKGVINLRGKIIPVIDLRIRFGMEEKSYTERTCVVVIENNLNEAKKFVGFVVDTVTEVLNIQEEEIERTVEFGPQTAGDFLMGLGKKKDKVILLIDVDNVLNGNELASITNRLIESDSINSGAVVVN